MDTKANLLIRKGRVIDPASGRDDVADLLVEEGRLVRVGASLDAPGAEIMEAEGLWVIPGLVDSCVHLSLPGEGPWTGDVASECRAAAGGGHPYGGAAGLRPGGQYRGGAPDPGTGRAGQLCPGPAGGGVDSGAGG